MSSDKKVWVLTREENQYDQYGEYFVAWFSEKPTYTQLGKVTDESIDYMTHILNGGGRTKEMEDTWYHLRQMADGEVLSPQH